MTIILEARGTSASTGKNEQEHQIVLILHYAMEHLLPVPEWWSMHRTVLQDPRAMFVN